MRNDRNRQQQAITGQNLAPINDHPTRAHPGDHGGIFKSATAIEHPVYGSRGGHSRRSLIAPEPSPPSQRRQAVQNFRNSNADKRTARRHPRVSSSRTAASVWNIGPPAWRRIFAP